ncbi:MAG: hypothetical protein BGO67_11065 [Alphaproteobacteria bacterium 41-28]|nr:MAG: hypothetical protein BGO67_11065 [Alphaproteobacteria bacterium 41-28]
MNKWLNQFLEKPDISDKPDKSDRFGSNMNMSDLSDSSRSLLEENLGNMSKTEPDISDRFGSSVNMSGLSGSSQDVLEENLGNMSETEPDISDRLDSNVNMSGLSGCHQGLLEENLRNKPETEPDISDRFDSEKDMSGLSVFSYGLSEKVSFYPFDRNTILHNFEERVAIAEVDGHQNFTQAQRIAYQDVFIAVLNTLPYEENYEDNWLDKRIKAAKEWLTIQGLQQPK